MIELWLDLSCPWCQGALPVMKRLLKEEAPTATIVWRPVRLHPLAAEGVDFNHYLAKFSDDPKKLAAMRSEIEDYNRLRGRDLRMDTVIRLYNPRLAHRLLALCRHNGRVDLWNLAEALWDANWRDGVNIGELASLQEALKLSSVPQEVWKQLEQGEGGDLVDLDRERATAIGLDGVPRFYLNNTIVPAWLDVETVGARLRAALS